MQNSNAPYPGEKLGLSFRRPRKEGATATMAGEKGNGPQRAPNNDSSPVVLHARQTTFVMLIVSALVAAGVLTENIARLSRAFQEAEIVMGLMDVWRAARRDREGPVSVANILAGVHSKESFPRANYELQLETNSNGKKGVTIGCRVDLDLYHRFFIPKEGTIRRLVVHRPSRDTSDDRISWVSRNYFGHSLLWDWEPNRIPYDLAEFSSLWDSLANIMGSAQIDTNELESRIGSGVAFQFHKYDMYNVGNVTAIEAVGQSRATDIFLGPVDDQLKQSATIVIMIPGGNRETLAIPEGWVEKIDGWNKIEFDSVATVSCLPTDRTELGIFHVIFPVKLRKEPFDWIEAWIDQAIAEKRLAEDAFHYMRSKLRLSFSDAFADLYRQAEGLESLELTALRDWLRGRLDKEGQNIEVAGIGVPRHLLRSLGLFLILVVQGYAARHLSEAATRMESSADRDPGAFQAWIALYDGRLSLCATLAIAAAPTAAALTVMWALHAGSFWTPYFLVSGGALIVSLMLLIYSIRNVVQLRAAARRHRTDPIPDPTEENA